MDRNTISTRSFYNEYHGHKTSDLKKLHRILEKLEDNQKYIYFCGDSTLDNKYWFNDEATAVNGYETALSSPRSRCDVAYWVNKFAEEHKTEEKLKNQANPENLENQENAGNQNNFVCINTSIEESTLSNRDNNNLLPQDEFIRDNITKNDVLVVSVGGNDVALKPSAATIASVLAIIGQSFITGAGTKKFGTGHFVNLFGRKTQTYIENLISKTKPKLVIVGMLYFLDENANASSWAGGTLGALRYNSKPEILQNLIRTVYEKGTTKIEINGTKVVHLPFFEFLDGKDTTDYAARVEPSAKGGQKMGRAIFDKVLDEY